MTSNTTLLNSEVSNHHENAAENAEAIRKYVSIVCLTILVFFGTIGNSLVIWVAGFRMKPKVTNVWLVNLAVADLIFCLTRVITLIKQSFFNYWPFGVFLCKFTGFFKYANMFCSVFLLAVISVDRALCICCPVFTRKHRTLCAARVVSVVVWIVVVIFNSQYFVYRQVFADKNNLSQCLMKKKGSSMHVFFYIRFICGFLLPFLVILICYTLAAVGICRTRLSGKSRPLRILAVLVCAFFLCWAPYHFLGLVILMHKENMNVFIGWSIATNLVYFNSCINPLLYFCMGLDLRQQCKVFHGAFERVTFCRPRNKQGTNVAIPCQRPQTLSV